MTRLRGMIDISKLTWDDLEKLHKNKVFCAEAWASLSSTTSGKWRMCCYATRFKDDIRKSSPIEHMNGKERRQMRLDMLAGVKTHGSPCERCHHAEAQGNDSRRTRMMDSWRRQPEVMDKIVGVIRTTAQDGTIIPRFFERIDVKFTGNKCNLRCFTCVPQSSSAFAVEAKKIGNLHEYDLPEDFDPVQDPFGQISSEMTDKFWRDFDAILPVTHILNFTGGEPFMIDAYWEMIERAVQSGAAAQMELHLSSNMTVIKHGKRSVMDYFGEFKRVRLQASLDGTAEYNHYIRYPSDYDAILKNIHMVQDAFPNVEIVVSTVVSALNVKVIPSLYDDLSAQGIQFAYDNILHVPVHQRIEWLPDRVKQQYLETEFNRPDAGRFADLIALLKTPEDLGRFDQLVARCRSLDRHRGTNYLDLWPEFDQ